MTARGPLARLGSALDRIESALLRPWIAALLLIAVALGGVEEARARQKRFPASPEDFSHLLAADTFARGRLANPAPAHASHFESPLILVHPHYVSALPPAEGALLAVGQRLGEPLRGSALGLGLASAAVAWMLAGWLPGLWPLAGGLALVLHPRLVGIWGAGYSNGLPAVFGAALLVGSLPRVLRGRACGGVALGIGAGVLALSQPFHGLVAALPAAGFLLLRLWRRGPGQELPVRALAAAASTLALVAAFHAWYDWRTTGSARTTPWALYRETYAPVPDLLFLERGSPAEPGPALAARLDGEGSLAAESWARRRTWEGFWEGVAAKLHLAWSFFLLPALAAVFLALPFALREPGVGFALAAVAVYLLALPLDTRDRALHLAAYLPISALLFTTAIKRWCDLRLGRLPIGALAVMALLIQGWVQQHLATFEVLDERQLHALESRAEITRLLQRRADRGLVLVRYASDASPGIEWVYNEADLDQARLLFARSLSPEQDRELVLAYPERRVWVLNAKGSRLGVAAHPDAPAWRGEARPEPEAPPVLSPEEEQRLQEEVARKLRRRGL
jgi:hypothetical protein